MRVVVCRPQVPFVYGGAEVVADQRAFNDAVLKLIDDLDERIARLEQR